MARASCGAYNFRLQVDVTSADFEWAMEMLKERASDLVRRRTELVREEAKELESELSRRWGVAAETVLATASETD